MTDQTLDKEVEKLINQKLDEIEQKEQVKILYAVESGSRAWGFASPDSDYDVRFVYIRPIEYYLRLEEKKDFINWELNKILDINGWDLSKTLQHFYKSNATLYEWSGSPIVYRTTPEWKQIQSVSEKYFSCKSCMYHYYGTANRNFHEYLLEEFVTYKKYFYVLRPMLAYQWIAERKSPPPVRFSDLVDTIVEGEKKERIKTLLERKKQMLETDKGERLESFNHDIEEKLIQYKEQVFSMPEDRNADWKMLDQLFLEILQRTKIL